MSRTAVERTSKTLENQIRQNITPSGGLSLDELADAGHPLGRGSRFNPSAAGLDKRYQLIRQSGALLLSLGTDFVGTGLGSKFSAFVGFDDSGGHSSVTVSGRTRFVQMSDLLSWLMNGTPVLVGRPVLINSLADAVPLMRQDLKDLGLFPIKIARARRQAVDR